MKNGCYDCTQYRILQVHASKRMIAEHRQAICHSMNISSFPMQKTEQKGGGCIHEGGTITWDTLRHCTVSYVSDMIDLGHVGPYQLTWTHRKCWGPFLCLYALHVPVRACGPFEAFIQPCEVLLRPSEALWGPLKPFISTLPSPRSFKDLPSISSWSL